MKKRTKIAISGATGFIGRHLVRRLGDEGVELFAIVRPSTRTEYLVQEGVRLYCFEGDVKDLCGFMQSAHFDGAIHLASAYIKDHLPSEVNRLIESNLFFSTAFLEASVRSCTPWFINTGTFWQHYEDERYSPVNLYAATKQAFEDIAEYYIQTSEIDFVTVKLNDTFGPGDLRPKIMNRWKKIADTGETLDMSAGEQVIDLIYIGDVIDAYLQVISLVSGDTSRRFRGRSFAVRSPERMTLKQLAELFEQVTKTTLNIHWGKRPYRSREVMVPWTQGEIVPGWKPKISIGEGIDLMFNKGSE